MEFKLIFVICAVFTLFTLFTLLTLVTSINEWLVVCARADHSHTNIWIKCFQDTNIWIKCFQDDILREHLNKRVFLVNGI